MGFQSVSGSPPSEGDTDDLIAAQLPQLELEAQVLAELDESAKNKQPDGLVALNEANLDAKQKRKFDHLKAKISNESKTKRAKVDPESPSPDIQRHASSAAHELPENSLTSSSSEFVEIRAYPGLRVRRRLYKYMYPFQRAGLEFLARQFAKNSGGLLAHDLGLGKTLQTVAFLGSLLESRLVRGRILIVCPATLAAQWVKSFNDEFSDLFVAAAGLDHSTSSPASVVVVASYETVRAKEAMYMDANFSVVVADEAQRLRNPFSQTTTVLKNFRTSLRIALSGTPIQNNLQELWSIMDFVRPGVLGTSAVFNEELAKPVELGCRPHASFKDAQRAYRAALLITQLVDPFMHKKSKYDPDVQRHIQLPEKHEQVLFVHMDFWQYAVYSEFVASVLAESATLSAARRPVSGGGWGGRSGRLPPQEAGRLFRTIATLRKLANHAALLGSPKELKGSDSPSGGGGSGKLQVLMRLLRQWRREGERVLVFSQSLRMLDLIGEELRREGFLYARVDGGTPMGEREKVIAEFGPEMQSGGETQVLLVTTKVMGVGTNLQGASRVVIVCPSWNVADDAQARERSWRIGQKKPVEVYRLISVGTIEEIVYKRQIYKQHLSQKILLDPRQQGTDLFSDLKNDLLKIPPPPPGYAEWRKANNSSLEEALRRLLETRTSSGGLAADEDNDDEDDDDIKKLAEDEEHGKKHAFVAAVWNQRDVETPLLHSGLVDHEELNAIELKAKKAIHDSATSSQSPVHPSTLPSSNTGASALAAVGRSRALLAAVASGAAAGGGAGEEDVELAKTIRSWFESRRDHRASSEEVLAHFAPQIASHKQLLFRACLKQLCRLSQGFWTLKTVQ